MKGERIRREDFVRDVVRSRYDGLTDKQIAERHGVKPRDVKRADESALARALRIYVYSEIPAPANRRELIHELEDEGVSQSTIRRLTAVSIEAPAHAPAKQKPIVINTEKPRPELAREAAALVENGMTILDACAKVGLPSNWYYKHVNAMRLPSRRRGKVSHEQRAQMQR